VGTGEFLDQEDLEEKYKTKPQRSAAILKNAKTFWCSISETLLYEDMAYKSNRTDKAKATRAMETNVLARESKLRPPKRPKTDAPNADGLPTQGNIEPPKKEPKPMTSAQETAITKKIADLEKLKGTFDEKTNCLKSKEEWMKFVPSYVHDRAEVARAQVDMVCPSITKASET
jgi:hypothetical protein